MASLRSPLAALSVVLLVLVACEQDPTLPENLTGPMASSIAEGSTPVASSAAAAALEQVGKLIFFDTELSIHHNEACAACHAPEWGFTGPQEAINAAGAVYEGSISGRFGNRKPPSAAYATLSPILYYPKHGPWTGGNFWDGRATGEKLGNPAADQAQGPFVNPAEQGLRDPACVVYYVATGAYADQYKAVWGNDIADIAFPADMGALCAAEGGLVALSPADRAKVNQEYDRIALSIAAYEASPEVNQFTSKFDAWRGGGTSLSKEEARGFALFQGKGKCVRCHVTSGKDPLFTDFTYDNLGVPTNPLNPAWVNSGFVDPGLGGFLGDEEELGKVKVPTLRNVDKRPYPMAVKAYMHNGFFKNLEDVVHFYNTRDVLPECTGGPFDPGIGTTCWPPPEVAATVNHDELGDLGLTPEEEAAIVAFLKTLSDGYAP